MRFTIRILLSSYDSSLFCSTFSTCAGSNSAKSTRENVFFLNKFGCVDVKTTAATLLYVIKITKICEKYSMLNEPNDCCNFWQYNFSDSLIFMFLFGFYLQ